MKCNEIQKLIAIDLSGELKPGQRSLMQDHLSECAACREWLAFHRSLENHMNEPVSVPIGMETRVAQMLASSPAQVPWLTRVLGNQTMKKLALSTSTVAVLAAGAFFLLPRNAAASTPLESFNKMRSAFTSAAQKGLLRVMAISGKDGRVRTVTILDGKELSQFPVKLNVKREGELNVVNLTVDMVELQPERFRFIRFGKAVNTLELGPKSSPNSFYSVTLDPKTKAPQKWDVIVVEGFPIDVNQLKEQAPKSGSKSGDVQIRVEGVPLDVRPGKRDKVAAPKPAKDPKAMSGYVRLRFGESATTTIRPKGGK